MRQILPVLLIAGMNLLPVVLFRQKFGKPLPMTMMAASLLAMTSQFLFHTFTVAWILCAVIALAGGSQFGGY